MMDFALRSGVYLPRRDIFSPLEDRWQRYLSRLLNFGGQFFARQAVQFEGGPNKAIFGVSSVSFVASAASTGQSVTIPAGAQANDIAVLCNLAWGSVSVPTIARPSGWTQLAAGSVAGDLTTAVTSYKKLVGGDAGSSITGMTTGGGSSEYDNLMLVFRGNIAISSVTPSTWNAESTAGNPALQTVSAEGQTAPLVVIGFAAKGQSTAAFSTASPAFDATVSNGDSDIIGGYKIYNSSPANHSIDMNDLGMHNHLHSGYLKVA